jgi:hypothetical protein
MSSWIVLRASIARAVERLGVQETSRRAGVRPETVLRMITPGARFRRGSQALVEQNAHKLGVDEEIAKAS